MGSLSILRHIALLLCYAVLAVAAGAALPHLVPDAVGGIAIAGVVFLAGGLAHVWIVLDRELDELQRRVGDLQARHGHLSREMGKNTAVAAEMRVLQTLLTSHALGVSRHSVLASTAGTLLTGGWPLLALVVLSFRELIQLR